MPRQLLTDAAGKPYYAPPPLPMAGDVDSETSAKLESAERIAREEQISRENAAKLQSEAHRYGSDAGMRLYKQRRDDTPYNKGGPVIKGEFKHANPTYTKFGQTADSSLLAKGRK